MRTWNLTLGIPLAALLSLGRIARAEQPVTVDSLLAQGFTLAAAVPSPIGPGLFLQKGSVLYACFVSEKPTTPALITAYCKPVH